MRKWLQPVDRVLTPIALRLSGPETRRLIKRRDGLFEHLKLERVFKKIDKDPWVKKSRKYYASKPPKGVG